MPSTRPATGLDICDPASYPESKVEIIIDMPSNRLRSMIVALLLIGAGPALTGCGGAVNVQTSGGGAEGFASLGVIMLGTSAIRYIRDRTHRPAYTEEELSYPPDEALPEHEADADEPDSGPASISTDRL
jgi:hypothetical protein